MSEIILHHYPTSTFSEKVRLALGLKRLSWRSVTVPAMMPKPDLTALTGGYRRAPVMQIGADVYCDTQLILRTIERMHPEPSLFPGGTQGIATALAWWADKFIFPPVLGVFANVASERLPPDFVAERKAFGFPLGKQDVAPHLPRYLQQGAAHLGWFEMMMADGHPFLLGDVPSAADLAVYCPMWLIRNRGGAEAERMLPLDPLWDWYDRVTAIGHGTPFELTAEAAIDLAKESGPAAPGIPADGDPSGLKDGSQVIVTPDDTGRDPVQGRLVAADAQEIVIRLNGPRIGDVHLHFPRVGFDVAAA